MKPSSNKSNNSGVFYSEKELWDRIDAIFAGSGITTMKETEQPEPTNNSGKDTYQIQFFPKKSKES